MLLLTEVRGETEPTLAPAVGVCDSPNCIPEGNLDIPPALTGDPITGIEATAIGVSELFLTRGEACGENCGWPTEGEEGIRSGGGGATSEAPLAANNEPL